MMPYLAFRWWPPFSLKTSRICWLLVAKKLPWFPLLPQTSSCYRKNIYMTCNNIRSPTLLLFQKGMSDNPNYIQSWISSYSLVIEDEKKIFNIRADKEGYFNGDITFGSSLTFNQELKRLYFPNLHWWYFIWLIPDFLIKSSTWLRRWYFHT